MKTVSSEIARQESATNGENRQDVTISGHDRPSRKPAKKRVKNPPVSLHDASLWPLRLTRTEVSRILRISQRALRQRVLQGRFPKADDGKTWDRATVEKYVTGGVKQYERAAEQQQRRSQLRMVGAK